MKKIVIVGGGSCGLICAVSLGRYLYEANLDASILLLDHKEKIGKKLLATGNGRCNLSNKELTIEHYQGHHVESIFPIIKNFNMTEYMNSIGLWTKYMGNLLYPQSEQAVSVLSCIERHLRYYGVKIKTGENVTEIIKSPSLVVKTNTDSYRADYIVLATGSDAASQFGSDGSGFHLLKQLGHTIYPTYPSLVQFICKKMDPSLKGTRIHGTFTLYADNKVIKKEKGEILFTQDGLSGISIMQLSRYYSLYKDSKLEIGIDALDEYDEKTLVNKIKIQWEGGLEHTLQGIVHQNYAKFLEKFLPKSYSYKELTMIASLLKDFRFEIKGTRSKKDAQVCVGGASLIEFNRQTLESKKVRHLYAGGELLDIAGDCGGYNLHFAFASGETIARAIYQEILMEEIKC